MTHKRRLFFILVLFPVLAFSQFKAESVMLPNGWQLTPAGIQYPLGDLPLNMATSPNDRWLAVTNNGYGRQCVQIFDVKRRIKTSDITLKRSWYGLCFSPDSRRLYVSAGYENAIYCFSINNEGKLLACDTIVMGKPWPNKIAPAGIAACKRTNQLFVG